MRHSSLYGILCVLFALCGLPAADWQVPEAPYRIIVKPEKADAPSSLDLSEILLPVPAKSLKIFADGKPVGFRLRDNGSLAVHPAPGAGEYRIYLGVTPEQPADQWGGNPGVPCPPPERLNMTFFGGGGQLCTVPELIRNRNSAIERSSRGMIRRSAWHTYRLLMALHLNSDLPLEPPRVRQRLQALERSSRRIASRNAGQRRAQYLAILSGGRSTAHELVSRRRNRQHQLKNQLKWAISESAKLDRRYRQVQTDAPKELERDLLGIVSRRWHSDYIATEVQMMTRPPETSEYYSCRFYGMLQIPEDGEYEFELRSNALTLVRLDGETVGRHHGTGGTPVETVRFKRRLARGSHDFELYHRLNTGVGQMLLSMRRGEEEPFRLLTSDDFEPARPLSISALENREGRKLPVISRHTHYQLYTGKQSKLELAQFTVRGEQEGVEFTWNGESRPISELPKRIALPTEGDTGLSFTCRNGEPLTLPAESRDRQDAAVPVPAGIFLKLWLPATLYDHETLDGQAEIRSKLPEAIDITFSLRSIADAPVILRQERKTLPLPAKPDERFDRSAPDLSLKLPLAFRGAPLRKTETYELMLEMPGFRFDRRKIRIVPVGADLKLTATSEGLIDGEGNHVILLQHRPTLAELRNWELLRKLDDELHKDRKLLVIAEDFGTGERSFSHQLGLNLKASGHELDFVPAPSEPSMLPAMIAASWPRISASDATSALLLLPCPAHLAGIEPWLRDRYISALLEKLKTNPNIRRVTLAALPGPEPLRAESAELASALRRLAREYNTNALDLRAPLEELLNTDASYQYPGSLNEYSIHPAGVADKIASILSKMLY